MRSWLLLASAVLVTVIAAAWTLVQLHEADSQRRTRALATDASYMVRNQVHALRSLLDELSTRWTDEFPHKRAELGVAELGATVIAYQNTNADDGRPELVGMLGPDQPFETNERAVLDPLCIPDPIWRRFGNWRSYITSESFDSTIIPPVGEAPAVPSLQSIATPFDPTLVWFSPDATGRARVNVLQSALLLRDGLPPGSHGRMRFVHLSTPLELPSGSRAEILCDVVNGSLGTTLHATGDDVGGSSEELIDPARAPWTFPLETDDRARIRLGSVAAQRPTPLLIGAWLLACLLLIASVFALRRTARAQLSAAALEASHELRTPLTVLRGELEVALRRERTGEDYRSSLQTALEEVEGLQHMVTSLLTLGARESSQHFETIALGELASERVLALQSRQQEREVSIEVEGSDLIQGAPALLQHAIDNLLENAARHSVAGGAIRVAVRNINSNVELSVEDDGPGVPSNRARKIFDRFYRGPATGKRQAPGAGLGLTVVRWVTQLHKGTIELDANVHERARFVMQFPRRARMTPTDSSATEPTPRS